MTYDILLYPRRPGQDWSEVVAADEAETPEEALQDEGVLAEGVATWARIEDRLRERLAGPVETWVAEETGGDVFGELTASDTGLQVELFHGSAAVSFPGGGGDDDDEVQDKVREAVRVVAEETGYEAYDPQTADGFDGTFAAGAVGSAGSAGPAGPAGSGERGGGGTVSGAGPALEPDAVVPAQDGAAGGTGPAGTGPADRALADPRQDPAFLRRRGVLYLLLGVLLTAYGLWRLTGAGGTGWITVVVIVIGVVDVLGGLMMLSLARAAAAARETEER